MKDLLFDIVTWLESEGYGTDGTNLFRDFSPDDPSEVICVYEYNSKPFHFADSTDRYVQFTVRDKSPSKAKKLCWELYNKMNLIEGQRLNFTLDRWCIVGTLNAPFKIKVDNKNRHVYGFNTKMTTYNDVY